MGAQYVYPESVGCIYDLEWPYILMTEQHPVWESNMIYDLSGSKLHDDIGRDIDEFIYCRIKNFLLQLIRIQRPLLENILKERNY